MSSSGWGRIAVGLVGVIVALNVALLLVDALLPSPSGPASSSYATASEGLAAWAELLERSGHPVERVRELPDEASLDPDSTLVVLEPDLLRPEEAAALRRFARDGGRVVAGGREPGPWIRTLLPGAPSWNEAAPTSWRPASPAPAVGALRGVRTSGEGAWAPSGVARSVLKSTGGGGEALLLTADAGDGELLLIADASPLQNRLLDVEDNAALALGLAGERGRPVAFLEAVHGFGSARGLGALPGGWRLALAGLGLAGLLLVAARARRLGPPDPEPPDPAPSRREYVDALAASLGRTRDVAATAAPVRDAASERLRARFRLLPDASADELEGAATRAGLPPDQARVVVHGARDDAELMAAGRALASLSDGARVSKRT